MCLIFALSIAALPHVPAGAFDHAYQSYGTLLTAIVRGGLVDYPLLVSRRHELDLIVQQFGSSDIAGWTRDQRMAFWINAYNLFTLKSIVDRYPIRGRVFTLQPRNSIRQIDGVWTDVRFTAGARQLSLDDIEHRILRPEFKDARVHFAINCASVSCPPLREEPYVAARLDAQLDDAARRYLAGPLGLQASGRTLSVSSLFKWYGDDFIPAFASRADGERDPKERAILGVIAAYGPATAQPIARSPGARVRFLRYDWSLNDSAR